MATTYPIDLGEKCNMKDCCISAPSQVSAPPDVYYPTLYLSGKQVPQLPESGEMTVRFNRKSETVRKSGDETSCSCELEITTIVNVTPKVETKKPARVEDILDLLRAEVESDKAEAD